MGVEQINESKYDMTWICMICYMDVEYNKIYIWFMIVEQTNQSISISISYDVCWESD